MQNNTAKKDDAALSVPDGGIGAFILDDDEIEQVYGDDENYGSEGIAQFPALTKKMAAMGREGDDVMAHLQTGELVIPAALLDGDPEMRDTIFAFLEAQGIEDPQRYVVGSSANSINPVTGAPEFFRFIKKAFKKIAKAVTNVVKGVVKVIKKIAPVVLPIALAFTPLGAVLGPALGSGIATLINGGSFKDALKSAAITGLTAGVFQGFTGPGTFGENIRAAVADPIGRFGQTVSGLGSTVTGGGFTGAGNLFTPYVAPGAAGSAAVSNVPGAEAGAQPVAEAPVARSGAETAPRSMGERLVDAGGTPAGGTPAGGTPAGGDLITPQQVANAATDPGTFTSNIKDAFTPGGKSFGQSMSDAFFPKAPTLDTTAIGNQAYTSAYKNAIDLGISETAASQIGIKAMDNAISSATAAAAPGFLRTYAPLALAGTALAAGSGMFTPVPGEDPGLVQYDEEGNAITGQDLIDQDPGKYLVGDLGGIALNPETGEYESVASVGPIGDLTPTYTMPGSYADYSVPTSFPTNRQSPYLMSSTPGGPFARPSVLRAAEGGAIFPRRNGGIMPDEGIPGQDSVRAMLMPGEFVMTTNAVRGLGNGDLNNGIQNMYSVMRNLESRGKAMA
jgi:hypothetical protein